MRRILVVTAVLLALALGLEMSVTYLAQRGMEKALERQYNLNEGLRVRINSFPFIISLIKNRIRDLRLEWNGDLYLSTSQTTYPVFSSCVLRMNDVELDMSAILQGRLEIRSLSRSNSEFRIPLADLEPIIGGVSLFSYEDGTIGAEISQVKFKIEVYISGDNRLTFLPVLVSSGTSGKTGNIESYIKGLETTVSVEGFPMRFVLLAAWVEGDNLLVKVDVKEWEGYLDASIGSL